MGVPRSRCTRVSCELTQVRAPVPSLPVCASSSIPSPPVSACRLPAHSVAAVIGVVMAAADDGWMVMPAAARCHSHRRRSRPWETTSQHTHNNKSKGGERKAARRKEMDPSQVVHSFDAGCRPVRVLKSSSCVSVSVVQLTHPSHPIPSAASLRVHHHAST